MTETQTSVYGQPLGSLEVILHKKLVGVVSDVVDAVLGLFVVVAGNAQDLVSIGIPCGVQGVVGGDKLQLSVRITVGGLGIADPFPEETALECMLAPNLREVSLTLGMYLLAYRPCDAPPASNPPGLKTRAVSLPKLPNDGICVTPFLKSP